MNREINGDWLSSATLYEAAGRIGALPSSIKPHRADVVVIGRALPVKTPRGNNLWLHHAIYAAQPGDVLVVETSNGPEFGYWGEVMAVAAQQRGLAGLVIDGGVRDSQPMLALGFPVFSDRICVRGTGKATASVGTIGVPVMIGQTRIHNGDLVVGDADGVVVIPADSVERVLAEGRRRDAEEQAIFQRLRNGERLIEIYDFPSVES